MAKAVRSFLVGLLVHIVLLSAAVARTALPSDMFTTITNANSIQDTIDDAFNNYDWSGKSVTITAACGVYFQNFKVSGKAVGQTGNSVFTIQGADTSNPTCVVIFANGVDACVATDHAVVTFIGIQCQTTGQNAIVCAKDSLCTMSFMGAGTATQYLLAIQNGGKLFYINPGGGRTRFYVASSAIAARYVTNPGSDMLFNSVDIIFASGVGFSFIVDFAANAYWHDVAVAYYQAPDSFFHTWTAGASVSGQKFRGYNHAGYSDGGNGLSTLANLPGTGYTIFGCASYNDVIPLC